MFEIHNLANKVLETYFQFLFKLTNHLLEIHELTNHVLETDVTLRLQGLYIHNSQDFDLGLSTADCTLKTLWLPALV